jgi:hypothetical protein
MIRDQPGSRPVAEEHLPLTPADGVRAPSPASITSGTGSAAAVPSRINAAVTVHVKAPRRAVRQDWQAQMVFT